MADESEYAAVLDEFRSVLNDLAGTHAMALMGVMRVSDWAENNPPANLSEKSMLFIGGPGDPNGPEGFSYQRWKWMSLKDKLGPEGPVVRDLGQQWIVMVTAQWNENFRARFGHAMGVPGDEVAEPLFGDLNKLRNDIVHHGGVASKKNTGRCELLDWFPVGHVIHPMAEHVAWVMGYMDNVQSSADVGGGPWEERESL